MPHKIGFNFSGDETRRCKGKENTDVKDREGEYFGNMMINEVLWAVVLWDGDEDPDFYKASCLLVESRQWKSIC